MDRPLFLCWSLRTKRRLPTREEPFSTRGVSNFSGVFADGQAVGCCALVAMAAGEFEVAKMAVTESAQGKGIGRRVLQKTIAEARASGARRLYLETNRTLATAVRLYESLGFKHIPAERIVPSVYARADVFMELLLDSHS